jgi:hypothetical protein
MAEYCAASATAASPTTRVTASVTIANVLKEKAALETMADNALLTVITLGFLVAPEAAKVPAPLVRHASRGSVTNPFMVTAAFTIFAAIETMFIQMRARRPPRSVDTLCVAT